MCRTAGLVHDSNSVLPLTSFVVATRNSALTSGLLPSHRSAAISANVTPPMNKTTTSRLWLLPAQVHQLF